MTVDRDVIEQFHRAFQAGFATMLEGFESHRSFQTDVWERPGGGGGITRIVEGEVIEKAAVNFSAVEGDTPPQISERLVEQSQRFYATGVSIIVHPTNPHAPTFHANIRYFETDTGAAWFGGGADLTPHYFYAEDAAHFHRILADVCDRHEVADYPTWKQQCQDYFFLPHRGESRGVGGVFYDHLPAEPPVWEFQRDLATSLPDAYRPLLEKRTGLPHTDAERAWQEIRRGRYAEFNLAWDRGTRFGLETNGRTESILASLPPRARWVYDHRPEPGSAEAQLVDVLTAPPEDWRA